MDTWAATESELISMMVASPYLSQIYWSIIEMEVVFLIMPAQKRQEIDKCSLAHAWRHKKNIRLGFKRDALTSSVPMMRVVGGNSIVEALSKVSFVTGQTGPRHR